MISFDIHCSDGHVFEAWFKDGAAFEAQNKAGEVACPICGDIQVSKALMAPNVGSRSNRAGGLPVPSDEPHIVSADGADPVPAPVRQAPAGMFMHAMREMRRFVEQNCENVGEKFPEEVRKIHYGETEHRNIYGEATEEAAKELDEEGIDIARVPWVPRDDA
ncbi:MAG: DUF1178 family protein [Alphaproteobacteria bacterium]